MHNKWLPDDPFTLALSSGIRETSSTQAYSVERASALEENTDSSVMELPLYWEIWRTWRYIETKQSRDVATEPINTAISLNEVSTDRRTRTPSQKRTSIITSNVFQIWGSDFSFRITSLQTNVQT